MQLYSVKNTSPGRKDPDAPFLHPVRDASLLIFLSQNYRFFSDCKCKVRDDRLVIRFSFFLNMLIFLSQNYRFFSDCKCKVQDAGLEGTTVLPKDTFLTECKICEMQAKLIIIIHYLFLVPQR